MGAFIGRSFVLASTVTTAREARSWRPIRQPDGGLLLFNGYIDNRAWLSAALSLPGASDAELYAGALAAWGDDAELKVLGQFCSALISATGAQVRLARSPIYAPPLHIWTSRDELVVASFPRVVLAAAGIPERIDEQKVADSLVLNFREESRSWF